MNKLTAIGFITLTSLGLNAGCVYDATGELDEVGTDTEELRRASDDRRSGDPLRPPAHVELDEGLEEAAPELVGFAPERLAAHPSDLVNLPHQPSSSPCGDGIIAVSELCDDGNRASGDGCSAQCTVEWGFHCKGAPSECKTYCGDEMVAGAEACDDGNFEDGDGCSTSCKVEDGFECLPTQGVCKPVCGDGIIVGNEACDDENTIDGDGCSAVCRREKGFVCEGEPTECESVCGDGLVRGRELCDDGNVEASDGCSAECEVEPGWTCDELPDWGYSYCKPECVDTTTDGQCV
jgi:cysteine-rich repeat protein